MNDEEEFFRAFTVPAHRARFLSLLESKKGRDKLVRLLDHFDESNFQHAMRIPVDQQAAFEIEKLLRRKGSFEICHIMSTNHESDQKKLPLDHALKATIGNGFGTIISCIPGKLAYFEGEEPNERYILELPVLGI